jgi:hypothetical protein
MQGDLKCAWVAFDHVKGFMIGQHLLHMYDPHVKSMQTIVICDMKGGQGIYSLLLALWICNFMGSWQM